MSENNVSAFPDLGGEVTGEVIESAIEVHKELGPGLLENILPVHRAQMITYMRLSKTPIGLLINFNKKTLKDGVQRFALAEFQQK